MTSAQGHHSALKPSQLLSNIIRSFFLEGDVALLAVDLPFMNATW
jgi:hypothetical protein